MSDIEKQNQNDDKYYLKLVAQGCFYFLSEKSDEKSNKKSDEKIAGLYTQGAGPCACIVVKNFDNSKILLAHVGDNNDISDEHMGLRHWINLISNQGQDNIQVEVHLGCGRNHGNVKNNELGYNDWFNRVKNVLQNQSINGRQLYTFCRKNNNEIVNNAEEAIIKQPINNQNHYNVANETGIVLRKGYNLPPIRRKIMPERILKRAQQIDPYFKPPVINQNLISGITKGQRVNQNPEETVIFDDTIGKLIHMQSNLNMQENAKTIQDQLDKKLKQLVYQRYQEYLTLKKDSQDNTFKPVEIPETVKKNANIKVPLTDQAIINEYDYNQPLTQNDFQEHPEYFNQIKRYKIDELKLFQELKKSNLLNYKGEKKLKRLELLKTFKTQDDIHITSKHNSWQEYIRNRENNKNLQRSNSCPL